MSYIWWKLHVAFISVVTAIHNPNKDTQHAHHKTGMSMKRNAHQKTQQYLKSSLSSLCQGASLVFTFSLRPNFRCHFSYWQMWLWKLLQYGGLLQIISWSFRRMGEVVTMIIGDGNARLFADAPPLIIHSALALFAKRTRIPTSARSIGFCVIWARISRSTISEQRNKR